MYTHNRVPSEGQCNPNWASPNEGPIGAMMYKLVVLIRYVDI